jgi:hypothetical protein
MSVTLFVNLPPPFPFSDYIVGAAPLIKETHGFVDFVEERKNRAAAGSV